MFSMYLCQFFNSRLFIKFTSGVGMSQKCQKKCHTFIQPAYVIFFKTFTLIMNAKRPSKEKTGENRFSRQWSTVNKKMYVYGTPILLLTHLCHLWKSLIFLKSRFLSQIYFHLGSFSFYNFYNIGSVDFFFLSRISEAEAFVISRPFTVFLCSKLVWFNAT